MLVTKEQAKKLRESGMKNVGIGKCCHVSEALDFMREEKGIECGVQLYHDMARTKAVYKWMYFKENEIGYYKYDIIKSEAQFDTHKEAESALLDAVIKYIEENENNPRND